MKDLQLYQAAQRVGIQTTGAGGAEGRKVHSRAGPMLRGRSQGRREFVVYFSESS